MRTGEIDRSSSRAEYRKYKLSAENAFPEGRFRFAKFYPLIRTDKENPCYKTNLARYQRGTFLSPPTGFPNARKTKKEPSPTHFDFTECWKYPHQHNISLAVTSEKPNFTDWKKSLGNSTRNYDVKRFPYYALDAAFSKRHGAWSNFTYS